MDFMPLRLNSSSLACSICALAAIILQLVSMECQNLYMVDSPITQAMNGTSVRMSSPGTLNSKRDLLHAQHLSVS